MSDLQAVEFTGRPPSRNREVADFLPVDTVDNDFELIHAPFDWEIVDGEWLPVLHPVYFYPGLNNYTGDTADRDVVRAMHRRKDCVVLDPGNAQLGSYRDYVRTVPAYSVAQERRGEYYMTMWDTPVKIGNRVSWNRNLKGYNAFRKYLVENGIVKLSQMVVRVVVDVKQQIYNRHIGMPVKTPAQQEFNDRLKEELRVMRATKIGDLEAPVPARVARSQQEKLESLAATSAAQALELADLKKLLKAARKTDAPLAGLPTTKEKN